MSPWFCGGTVLQIVTNNSDVRTASLFRVYGLPDNTVSHPTTQWSQRREPQISYVYNYPELILPTYPCTCLSQERKMLKSILMCIYFDQVKRP
jgi:hypothetical protein